MKFLKGKKILLVGLGKLGGGVATAKFLIENGAKLTVMDLNSAEELRNSLLKLKGLKLKYILGEHREKDFKNNEIIICNQAVSVYNKWVQFARKNKKQIETDLSLMLKILEKKKPQMEYIAITGTRGKTTTATWIHHFLKPAFIGGNIPELAPLKVLNKILGKGYSDRSEESQRSFRVLQNDRVKPLVLEIPSYQLEYFKLNKNLKAPKVAVITNLYIDHLNRHGNMENYALVKSRIFSNQTKSDFLILNFDIDNDLFLKQKAKSKIYYVSLKSLPTDKNGLYFYGDGIYFQQDKKNDFITLAPNFSQHQKYNLLMALLAVYLYGDNKWDKLVEKISTLPEVKFRQEVVLKIKKMTVINDSAATSPEATIAAIERFKNQKDKMVMITGGTDKELDFKNLAKEINKNIAPENLYLLNGTGTQKLIMELINNKFPKTTFRKEERNEMSQKFQLFEGLEDIIKKIKKRKDINCIVFSPGAASFEKFKNEFDRGQKFNKLIK
ncbi:hypothetical protein HZB05_02315 [Candidatus Wolfebacteria bacterium]|nr:hypothetical protein [Candidatus Wolfebacteria bacterium]